MKISKGSIVMIHGIWYVVVTQTVTGHILCICDNNNTCSFSHDEPEYVVTAKEAMFAHTWGIKDGKLTDLMEARAIPVEVIAEVLAGCHDERFRGEK